MPEINVALFLYGAKLDFNRVREVLKNDHHTIRFITFNGDTIESNLPYIVQKTQPSNLIQA